jgi:hypothetical protein
MLTWFKPRLPNLCAISLDGQRQGSEWSECSQLVPLQLGTSSSLATGPSLGRLPVNSLRRLSGQSQLASLAPWPQKANLLCSGHRATWKLPSGTFLLNAHLVPWKLLQGTHQWVYLDPQSCVAWNRALPVLERKLAPRQFSGAHEPVKLPSSTARRLAWECLKVWSLLVGHHFKRAIIGQCSLCPYDISVPPTLQADLDVLGFL